MMMNESQTSTISNYGEVLESIGYKLIDCGDHWRTKALFRNGDNTTAVKVYKNSGVWMDFIANKGCQPFQSLVRLSVKDSRKTSSILKDINSDSFTEYVKKERIEMEKIYPEESLEKLFPNYTFYKQKNIGDPTLRKFKAGLAGLGKMYGRMVFPIYNGDKQIIGFSGRKVNEDNHYPKWKQVGKKSNWIYPANLPDHDCIDSIKEKKEVILVESIGDALALYESGIKNVLVLFGVLASPAIISFLSSLDLERITISTNNDKDKKTNVGMVSSIKNFLNLSIYFDLDRLEIKFPPHGWNDFGDANENDYNMKTWLMKSIDQSKQREFIHRFVKKQGNMFSQKHIKLASQL